MRSLKQASKALFALSAALSLHIGCGSGGSTPPPPVAPAITTQPANQTVLEGATAIFTVTATGTAPLSYQWKKGATAVTGATLASYTTPASVMADSGSSFTVTVTNAMGNMISSAATLTVNPAPPTITSQPSKITVTAGSTATFTVVASGTAPFSYQWSLGGSPISGATSASYTTPVTTLADNGASFTVTVTDAQGTVASSVAILTVQAAPVFTTQPVGTTTVTAGASMTFTAAATGNPAPTYQWYKGTALLTGQTAATLTIASPTLADAGSYTVVATNSLASVTSGAAVLIVNQVPIFTTQPASLIVTAPASATFTAAASGFPFPTFQWQKGGVSIAGATGATYTLATTSLTDAATYTCVATNTVSVTSNGAILTVYVTPAITTQPAGTTVTAGATVSFSVVATGTPAPTYQWYKGAALLTGQTAATITIASPTLADAGSYKVVATNGVGSVTSSAAVLVVNQVPIFTTQPASLIVTAPTSATFTAAASGFPVPTYQWQKGGASIAGATGATFTLATTSLPDAATYTCVATNTIGPTTSNGAILTVYVPPAITTQPAGTTTVTAGFPASFSVVASGTPAPTYQWQKTNVNISGATNSSYTIASTTLADAGSYTVLVSNAGGNVTSSAAVLTVNVPPVVTNQPGNQVVVAGQTASFSVTATGTPAPGYQWQKNGTNISGATGSTYITPATAIGDSGSTFHVVVANSVATVISLDATLTVNPAPAKPVIITPPASQTVSIGTPVIFTVVATGTPAPTYQWYKNGSPITSATSSSYTIASVVPADAGNYAASATNGLGSDISSAAALTVNTPPVVTNQPVNQIVLVGQTATFSVTVTPNPAPSYQWRKIGVAIAGATGSTYTTPITVISDSGSTFDVVVTNALGTVTSNAATLTVNLTPVAPTITAQPVSQAVAPGASVTFSVVATGIPAPGYQWQKDNVNIIGAIGSSFAIAITKLADAGAYTVLVTNTTGSVMSSGAALTFLSPPVITIQPASQTVNQGTSVTLAVVANGNPGPTYQWQRYGVDLIAAISSTFTISSAAPGNAGDYRVVVTNTQGIVTSNTATLTVTPNYSVFGQVILASGGSGVYGVTVSINTTPATTALTDSNGNFTLPNIPNGTYTVTPSITGPAALFFPPTQSVTVASANANNVQFQASVGYTVSGTVNYLGTKTGRVYTRLDGNNNGQGPGVSISAAGAFTIRGVSPGTYTLNAWMENIGLGNANASNPAGSVSVTVASSNYTVANVLLVDPAAINLAGAAGPGMNVVPRSGGAFLEWQPLQNAQWVETADHYQIQWSTSNSFTTLAGDVTVPAMGGNNPMYFANGLTDGTPYSFRIYAKAGATTSNAFVYPTAVTPGPGTGGNTISGAVSFTGTATGSLYVGLYNENTGIPYTVRIANPVSPQAFTLPGVPNGTFFFFGIVDQDNNGYINLGDITNTNGNAASALTVSGNMPQQNLILSSANVTSSISTSHQKYTRLLGGASESYSLQFRVDQNMKLPVNVAIQMGTAMFDIGKSNNNNGYSQWVNLGTLRPLVGDPYAIQLGYSDGSTQNLPLTVAAVLDTFPTNLSPNSTAAGGTIPTFTWAAPSPAPAGPYTFGQLWVQQQNSGNIWSWPSKNDIPSTTFSVLYNVDGKATQSPLSTGLTYVWSIAVRDAARNEAQQTVEFKP